MKNLIFLLVILAPYSSYSQVSDNTDNNDTGNFRKYEIDKLEDEVTHSSLPRVMFDFSKPESITLPKRLKKGSFYQVDISGINLNNYMVIVNSQDTVYGSPLNFPTFGTVDLSSLSELVGKLNTTKISTVVDQKLTVPDSVSTVVEKINIINSVLAEFYEAIDADIAEAKVKLNLKKEIEATIARVTLLSIDKLALLFAVKSEIDAHRRSYMVNRVLSKVGKLSTDVTIGIESDIVLYDEIRIRLKKNQLDVAMNLKNLIEFIGREDVRKTLADAKNLKLKKDLTNGQKALQNLLKKMDDLALLISVENVEKQLVSVVYLYKENRYTSLPIQYNGEQAVLDIKFIPKDSASILQPYTLPTLVFPKRNSYWSVGPSVYYARFLEQRVGLETNKVDTTLSYSLLGEKPLRGEIGAALLLRGGCQFGGGPVGAHVAAGTGLSLGSEIRPRMLFGGGFTLGERHSLAIDFGGIAGYINVLSESADFNKEYFEVPEVLVSKLAFEYFYSVGYTYRF